jgi:hypothetical protein
VSTHRVSLRIGAPWKGVRRCASRRGVCYATGQQGKANEERQPLHRFDILWASGVDHAFVYRAGGVLRIIVALLYLGLTTVVKVLDCLVFENFEQTYISYSTHLPSPFTTNVTTDFA